MNLDSQDAEGNIIPLGDIIFMTAIADCFGFEPIDDPGDPNIDQMQAFLRNSFVFAINGHKGNEAESESFVLAMPEQAVMYMIQVSMERLIREGKLVPAPPPGVDPTPRPPTSPGGLFLP